MDTTRHEPTCRVRRHAHVQHLLAADEHGLAELQAALATLPLCATGRVFVEVPDASWIAPLDAPGRTVVTWLDRSARGGRPSPRPRGEALVRAVGAWADEMLYDHDPDAGDGPDAGEVRVLLLGGHDATARIVEHLTRVRGVDAAAIHVVTSPR